jgi:hypothetical protein
MPYAAFPARQKISPGLSRAGQIVVVIFVSAPNVSKRFATGSRVPANFVNLVFYVNFIFIILICDNFRFSATTRDATCACLTHFSSAARRLATDDRAIHTSGVP